MKFSIKLTRVVLFFVFIYFVWPKKIKSDDYKIIHIDHPEKIPIIGSKVSNLNLTDIKYATADGNKNSLFVSMRGVKSDFDKIFFLYGRADGYILYREKNIEKRKDLPIDFSSEGDGVLVFEEDETKERRGATYYFVPTRKDAENGRILIQRY